MTLIKKIQLAAEQNGFNVYVTGNKKDYIAMNLSFHERNAYKVITGDGLFDKMCSHLVHTRQDAEGYRFMQYFAGRYTCVFIDGDFKYVIRNSEMILVYKNKSAL